MDAIKITKRSALTIAEIAGGVLEHIPMTFSNSDLAPGRKVFFPIPMKKSPKDMTDFLYVYAESKLTTKPVDNQGFTDQDVIDEVGVYLFKKTGQAVSGCTYPINIFLQEVITDLSLRNRMIYKVNDMRNMVHLDDTFLELANNEYHCHKNDFGKKRIH